MAIGRCLGCGLRRGRNKKKSSQPVGKEPATDGTKLADGQRMFDAASPVSVRIPTDQGDSARALSDADGIPPNNLSLWRHESLMSSDGEFFECRSNFSDCQADVSHSQSLGSGGLGSTRPTGNSGSLEVILDSSPDFYSPPPSSRRASRWGFQGRLSWRARSSDGETKAIHENHRQKVPDKCSGEHDAETASTSSTAADDVVLQPRLSGCLSILRGSSGVFSERTLKSRRSRKRRYPCKPEAGLSLRRLGQHEDTEQATECWTSGDPTTYNVRCRQYMKTKSKVKSTNSLYELFAVDMFSFEMKENHIARKVQLPVDPIRRTEAELAAIHEDGIPLSLIINLQLPTYAPSLFGNTDGPGHSLVYYFVLREGFNPSSADNPAAVGLLRRFVHNGREENSEPTRSRLKLIPRVVNIEEWSAAAPLSKTESRLISNYNEKPLLTRPQQTFHQGPNYFEVDLDVHIYAYLARKAFNGLLGRLDGLVFETAFVLQGNRSEELPEQVLACARVYRLDFSRKRPFLEIAQDASKARMSVADQGLATSLGERVPAARTADDSQGSGQLQREQPGDGGRSTDGNETQRETAESTPES